MLDNLAHEPSPQEWFNNLRRDLVGSWLSGKYSHSLQILQDVSDNPENSVYFSKFILDIGKMLLPLHVSTFLPLGCPTEDVEALKQLRDKILSRVIDMDICLAADFFAMKLASCRTAEEWISLLPQYLHWQMRSIDLRWQYCCWEVVQRVYWAAEQLLLFPVGEHYLVNMLLSLRHVRQYLNHEALDYTVMKESIDAKRVEERIIERLCSISPEALLPLNRHLIIIDSNGALWPIIVNNMVNSGIDHPIFFAVLYKLVIDGRYPKEHFLSLLAENNFRCFLPLSDRTLIVCGELPINHAICQGFLDIESPKRENLRLTWWYDIRLFLQLSDTPFVVNRVPAFVRELLAQNKADLVFNATQEGHYLLPAWTDWIDRIVNALHCSPRQLVFMHHNRSFAEEYNKIRPASIEEAYRIITLDSLIMEQEILHHPPENPVPTKKFLSFNQRPHKHRVALLLSIIRDGLLDQCNFSFNQSMLNDATGTVSSMTGSVVADWMNITVEEAEELIQKVDPMLPLRLDWRGKDQYSDGSHFAVNENLFSDSAIYLVTETEMVDRRMVRWTEKTVKGLAAMIPFIIFGSYHTLDFLREIGFKTFSPLIDERYDRIENPQARFQAAYQEVRRLASMSLSDLIEIRTALQPVLLYNRKHLEQIPNTLRKTVQEQWI